MYTKIVHLQVQSKPQISLCMTIQMWRCKSNYCANVAKLSGYVDVKSESEDDLLDAVCNVGPVW